MLLLFLIGIIGIAWVVLTILAQQERKAMPQVVGTAISENMRAVMVYNPDLFYNLDEQVCTALAEGLSGYGWESHVLTVADARKTDLSRFTLTVFCANTYNWAPDRPVSNFIKNSSQLKGRPVVAITLGSGSTARSQRMLEEELRNKGARLLASRALWLMRPNDTTDRHRTNTESAKSMARSLGEAIAGELERSSQ